MPTSYNGWPASPTLPIRPLVVAGESFVPGVLDDDDVWTVLQYVAEQMHKRVEPIVRADWHQADDWGFSYRASTGSSYSLSCHASGTAIDYNSTRHPYGVATTRNFSLTQITEIRKIVAEAEVVVWGGEWHTPDAMHFEISGNRAQVAAAASRIRNMEDDEMQQADWERLRTIVREEVRHDDFVAMVAKETQQAVWARGMNVTNAEGTTVKKTTAELLKGSWEAARKLLTRP